MRIGRILHILCLLASGPKSLTEIIDNLSSDHNFDWHRFSSITIYRDISTIRSYGFSVSYNRNTKKYCLDSSPITLSLSPAEIISLSIIGNSYTSEQRLPYANELQSALQKMAEVFSPRARKMLFRPPHFSIHLQPVADYSAYVSVIENIRRAIEYGRQVEIIYVSTRSDDAKERIIDPYELYFSEGGVRLQAYCHLRQKILEFRIDRIKNIKMLPTVQKSVTEQPEPFTFILKLDSKLAKSIGNRFTDQSVNYCTDGSAYLTARATNPFRLILQILAYGEYAEIIEPLFLRNQMADIAKKMSALYGANQDTP